MLIHTTVLDFNTYTATANLVHAFAEEANKRCSTFSLSSSKYSLASSRRWSLISVPRPRGSFHVSSDIANDPSAFDSHTYLYKYNTITAVRKLQIQSKRCTKNNIQHNVLLFVIIVLADHFDIVGNQVHRIETNTKLPNQIEVTSRLHLLHKS